jgi:TRAP-type uncharacterized transport system substrate-binding protein
VQAPPGDSLQPEATGAGPPIDRLLATHSDYVAYVIPGGMYPGNPDGIPTIGTQAVLVTSTLEIKDLVPSGSVIPINPGALNYYREAGLVH